MLSRAGISATSPPLVFSQATNCSTSLSEEDMILVMILVFNDVEKVPEVGIGHETFYKSLCGVCARMIETDIRIDKSYAAKEKLRDRLNLTIYETDTLNLDALSKASF